MAARAVRRRLINGYIYLYQLPVCAYETAIADSRRLRNGCYSVLEFGFLGGFPSVVLFPFGQGLFRVVFEYVVAT